MIHPDTELKFIDDSIGYGVFAKKFIPEGTITYIKDSLEIEVSPADFKVHNAEMQDVIEKFSYIDERGYRIVSWDIAKYVNHCCKCNTISTGYGFEIAIRDIEAGEQLTDEYGIFNIESEMPVFCGKDGCRKVVKPEDFDMYYQDWDKKIKKSLAKLMDVQQPLISHVQTETRKELENFLHDSSNYRSVYSLKNKNIVNSFNYSKNGQD